MRRRLSAIALAAFLLASAAGVGALPATASTTTDGNYLYLTTDTDPAQPTPGDNFTFTTRLTSPAESDEPYTVRRITVQNGTGDDAAVLDEKTFVGRVDPGRTLASNLSIGFDDPGTKDLFVEVVARVGEEEVTFTTNTTVRVYEAVPRVEASANGTVPGEPTDLSVTVANGLDGSVSDVSLRLAADNVTFDESTRIASTVAAGAERTFAFTATPEALGASDVEATLTYTAPDGTRRTTTETLDVRFRNPEVAGSLDVATSVAPALAGTETTLSVNVTNGLDQQIRQLAVEVESPGVTVVQNRRIGTQFASGAERTFSFRVASDELGAKEVTATITYTTANGVERQTTRTLSTTFTEPTNPGEIRLTGVEAVVRGGQLELSATASNVGSTPASAVLVEVGGETVTRADYFVGSVEGSDFASFTVRSAVDGNVSSVPVTVRYVVNGAERSYTTDVAVQQVSTPARSSGGGGPPLPLIGGVALLVVVVGGVLLRRRG